MVTQLKSTYCKECGTPLIETEWCGYPRHDKRFKRSCSLNG